VKLVALKIAVLQDLHHEPSSNRLTFVNRNHCTPTIRMLKKVMTALDADDCEAQTS